MEQSGEAPEPEQPAAQPADNGPDGPDARAFMIVGIVLLVAVIGIVAWLIGGDDGLDAVEREQERFPTPTTEAPASTVPATTDGGAATTAGPATTIFPGSTLPPATEAPTTTVAPATTPAPAPAPATTGAPPGTVPGSTAPPGATTPGSTTASSTPDTPPYVAQLVPSVAAFPELLATPEAAQAAIDAMLASGRHDIAAPGRTVSICAAVPIDQPAALEGRWEHDGRRIASSEPERREPPGFGECVDDDGEVLDTGAYQYIVSDSDGAESAAGGIVLGAAPVEQRFVNDGDAAICTIRIAPSTARYFEAYVFDADPIAPGSGTALVVAGVEQDVESVGCDGTVVASFSFTPDADVIQALDP